MHTNCSCRCGHPVPLRQSPSRNAYCKCATAWSDTQPVPLLNLGFSTTWDAFCKHVTAWSDKGSRIPMLLCVLFGLFCGELSAHNCPPQILQPATEGNSSGAWRLVTGHVLSQILLSPKLFIYSISHAFIRPSIHSFLHLFLCSVVV